MADERNDVDQDRSLAGLLDRWKVPVPPGALDARVLVSYRARAGGSPWRRLWAARVSLPLPVAALLIVALVAVGALALRGLRQESLSSSGQAPLASRSRGLADLRPLPEVRMRVTKAVEPR